MGKLFGVSVLEMGVPVYREPERPEEYNSPAKRRLWRKFVEADRKQHEAVCAEYEATKRPGEGFVPWAQRKINERQTAFIESRFAKVFGILKE